MLTKRPKRQYSSEIIMFEGLKIYMKECII